MAAPLPARRRWPLALLALGLATWAWMLHAPRPGFLPLATSVDGPEPSAASALLVFLHGRGSTLGRAETLARELRGAGLPPDVAVVLVQGPFPFPAPFQPWRHHWGDGAEPQARSRARLQALLDQLLAGGRLSPDRVTVAGFSQGAGVATDLAVEDARIGRVASLSPCYSILRGQLPGREGLRVLLAHGRSDAACPVEESRSLFQVLESARRPVRYLESDGGHDIPPEVVRALVELATAP